MELKRLKDSIDNDKIPMFMIFNVKNGALCKQYINSISKHKQMKCGFYNSADQVFYEISDNIKENNKKTHIILNDEKIIKNTNYINELINTNEMIILYFSELDSQSKFYKDNKQYIYDFLELDRVTLKRYINKKINMEENDLENFIDYCDVNFGCCLNELDKMKCLDENELNQYIKNKEYSDYRKIDIFNFIDEIINKNNKVFKEEEKLEYNLISLLLILYKKARNQFQYYGNSRIMGIMEQCINIDEKIKEGNMSNEYALDYLLLKVM